MTDVHLRVGMSAIAAVRLPYLEVLASQGSNQLLFTLFRPLLMVSAERLFS
jgi:hypothetical protein